MFLLEHVAETITGSTHECAAKDLTLSHNVVNNSFSKIAQFDSVEKCVNHSFSSSERKSHSGFREVARWVIVHFMQARGTFAETSCERVRPN